MLTVAGCTAARPNLGALYDFKAAATQPPLIVIPGILGSRLYSEPMQQELWPGSAWTLLFDRKEHLALDIDPLRIREVLANLVANAVRHTPAGGAVTLSIERTTNSVAITVRDTGAGLSADDLARVFDRFYKGPESRGSGLGLTIARSLARAHGGDITATSRPGIGTTMTVTVPV